jgi:hypothetical protein
MSSAQPITMAVEPEPPAEVAITPASRKRAFVNAMLLGGAIASTTILLRQFVPWLVGNAVVAAIVAASGIVLGVITYSFKKEVESGVLRFLMRPATRALIAAALIAQPALAIALAYVARQPIIRIVPGPQLDAELGFAGQTLRVTLDDGTSFAIVKPAPRPLYAGRWQDRVRYAISAETPKTREQIFESVLKTNYDLDHLSHDSDERADVAAFVERWQIEPQLMAQVDRSGARTLSATLEEQGNPPRRLRISEVEVASSDGVRTYVAELNQ